MSVTKMKSVTDKKNGDLLDKNIKGFVKDGTDNEVAQRGSERGADVVIIVD